MTPVIDRAAWLEERRRIAEERMDTLWAPIYDQQWGASIDPTHARFFERFLELCSPHAQILDAACGTGKYWPLILVSGRTIFGTDHSQGMLNRAHAKHPDIPIEKIGLQELDYAAVFESAICIDAMENVFPEDWPLLLHNLYHALKPEGYLYFTVELADEQETAQAFAAGQASGFPVVYGEWVHEGGYHYYPKIEQVKTWVREAGFQLVDEAVGDGYHHFLVQKPG